MKYLPSIAFEEMSGSAKGVTAAKTRGRKYIRNCGYGGTVRTSGREGVYSKHFDACGPSSRALARRGEAGNFITPSVEKPAEGFHII